MFSGAFSISHLIVVLVIVLLLFGTKKLKNLGSDLGGAIKGFKNALNDGEKKDAEAADSDAAKKVIDEKPVNPADLNKTGEQAKSEHK